MKGRKYIIFFLLALFGLNLPATSYAKTSRKPKNVIFVIDKSGSMLDHGTGKNFVPGNDPDNLRKTAVKLLTQLLNAEEDRIAIVQFAAKSETEADLPLTSVNRISNLDEYLVDLDKDEYGLLTDLKSGLDHAFEIYEASFDKEDYETYVILLSDGKPEPHLADYPEILAENAIKSIYEHQLRYFKEAVKKKHELRASESINAMSKYRNKIQEIYDPKLMETVNKFRREKLPIYTVALGENVDKKLLQKISKKTQPKDDPRSHYFVARSAGYIMEKFYDIWQVSDKSLSEIFKKEITVDKPDTNIAFSVDPAMENFVLRVVTKQGVDVKLVSPNGKIIGHIGRQNVQGESQYLFKITTKELKADYGEWTIEMSDPNKEPIGTVRAKATGQSLIILDQKPFGLDDLVYDGKKVRGVKFVVELENDGTFQFPKDGVKVRAAVYNGSSVDERRKIEEISLQDNGAPPDKKANDGLYSVRLPIKNSGDYTILTSMEGEIIQGDGKRKKIKRKFPTILLSIPNQIKINIVGKYKNLEMRRGKTAQIKFKTQTLDPMNPVNSAVIKEGKIKNPKTGGTTWLETEDESMLRIISDPQKESDFILRFIDTTKKDFVEGEGTIKVLFTSKDGTEEDTTVSFTVLPTGIELKGEKRGFLGWFPNFKPTQRLELIQHSWKKESRSEPLKFILSHADSSEVEAQFILGSFGEADQAIQIYIREGAKAPILLSTNDIKNFTLPRKNQKDFQIYAKINDQLSELGEQIETTLKIRTPQLEEDNAKIIELVLRSPNRFEKKWLIWILRIVFIFVIGLYFVGFLMTSNQLLANIRRYNNYEEELFADDKKVDSQKRPIRRIGSNDEDEEKETEYADEEDEAAEDAQPIYSSDDFKLVHDSVEPSHTNIIFEPPAIFICPVAENIEVQLLPVNIGEERALNSGDEIVIGDFVLIVEEMDPKLKYILLRVKTHPYKLLHLSLCLVWPLIIFYNLIRSEE